MDDVVWILWIASSVSFGIGFIKPEVAKLGWLCGGFMFAALTQVVR
jgi:hypothetical protein